jgi:hypothetical protein
MKPAVIPIANPIIMPATAAVKTCGSTPTSSKIITGKIHDGRRIMQITTSMISALAVTRRMVE